MLQTSLAAIQSLLKNNFPEAQRIYINNVPEDFIRPSFFVVLESLKTEQLTKVIKNLILTWRIYYFGICDSNGNINLSDSYSFINTLDEALVIPGYLKSPDGSVFIVSNLESAFDNGDLVAKISLEIQVPNEVSENLSKMQNIQIKYEEAK